MNVAPLRVVRGVADAESSSDVVVGEAVVARRRAGRASRGRERSALLDLKAKGQWTYGCSRCMAGGFVDEVVVAAEEARRKVEVDGGVRSLEIEHHTGLDDG